MLRKLPRKRIGLEFRGKLAHCQAADVPAANQRGEFFQKTSDNIFEARPLGVKVFGMEPHVKNAAIATDAPQPFSETT